MKYGFLVCLAYTQKLTGSERSIIPDPGPAAPPPKEVVEWCNTATLATWPDGDKSAAGCMDLGGTAQVNCLKGQANAESECSSIDGPAFGNCMLGAIEKCDVPAKAKQCCKAYGVNIISAPDAPAPAPGSPGSGGSGGIAIPRKRPPRANYRDRPDDTLKLRGHADKVSTVTPPAALLLGWLRWFAFGGCVAGFMLVGGNMAIRHKRGEGRNSQRRSRKADRLKAKGFAERVGMVICGGLPQAEMPLVNEVVRMSGIEQRMIVDWSTPPSWNPDANQDNEPPGRGRFLVKVGGRPGIPFKVELTTSERSVNDTNKRWSNSTTVPQAGIG